MPYDEWISELNITDSAGARNEYESYKENFKHFKSLAEGEYSSENIGQRTDKELMDAYKNMLKYPAEEIAPLLNEVTIELAGRETMRHMHAIGIPKWDKNHDIHPIFKWLGSNNVSQKKPDLQALEKRISVEYAKLERELDHELMEINTVTSKLIRSKLNDNAIIRFLQKVLLKYAGTRHMYEKVYGKMFIVDEGIDPETKKPYKNMRLINDKEARERNLSPEEKAFMKMFKQKTNKYREVVAAERGAFKTREGYIPHLNAHALEAYTSRGMLNAFMVSKADNVDSNVRNVKLSAVDPITGKKVTREFGYFQDAYKKTDSMLGAANTIKYIRIRNRALSLYKRGINEDGSKVMIDYVTRDTLLGGSWMDRFTGSRSVKATELPTFDLNHALTAYVKASAWKYGTKAKKTNDDFVGFDNLAMHIDGVIRLNHKYGNTNTSMLTQKVWWDKVMMGKNQTSFLGEKGDKVVDALNWATTVIALGFKTSIATGNIMWGKYSNIRNEGGREWAIGEKRFWGLDNTINPIKGVRKGQKLLRRYQLIDKNNMYDIGWSNKRNVGGLFTDLSLMPMTLSENWIQGAHFLGQLTEEEWNSYDEEGNIKPGHTGLSAKRIAKLEYDVRRTHGRGYSAMDQRMIGLYSMGRSGQMFKKWLITNYNERFGDEILNMYGEEEIGSMRQFGNMILSAFRGDIPMNELTAYYNSLPEHQRKAFVKAINGMGMLIFLGAFAMMLGDSDEEKNIKKNIRKLQRDAGIFYNTDRVSKLSRVYPYYTARYISRVGASAMGEVSDPSHVMK